ncbi:MAG: hypothetical protein LBC53_00300 [Spirochaetaceae bacterium]|nr:hypothetical protein [Spirochaetaceae bacterium]
MIFLKLKVKIFFAAACFALIFSACGGPPIPLVDDDAPPSALSSGGGGDKNDGGNGAGNQPETFGEDAPASIPPPTLAMEPVLVSAREALALLHLDEHPVLDAQEVAVVVEDFLSGLAEATGMAGVPVITEVAAHTITIDSGFAVKSSDSGAETAPASSELPFYRYTVVDSAGTEGSVIASGDKRIGGVQNEYYCYGNHNV